VGIGIVAGELSFQEFAFLSVVARQAQQKPTTFFFAPFLESAFQMGYPHYLE
jgi:hypothetical protein